MYVPAVPTDLQGGGEDRLLLALGHALLALVHGDVLQPGEEVLKDHVQRQDVLREPHHPTAADGGQGGVLQVLHLKHHTDLPASGRRG